MDASLNNYLKSLIPNWNYNDNPLDNEDEDSTKEQFFNNLANRILLDISQISITKNQHPNELICNVLKLTTFIKAYNVIENAAQNKEVSELTITELANKVSINFECSFSCLKNEDEQLENIADKFKELGIDDASKENAHELQIRKMVTLVKIYLNQNKFNIDTIGKSGYTQFYKACKFGDLEKAKILISLGCNPNIPTKYGYTPLFIACEYGFDEIVAIIVNSQEAELNVACEGITPFVKAVNNGHIKCARILAEAGVDINARDISGNTLFHSKLKQHKLEEAKILLSLGCNPAIQDFNGYTPFYTACENGMTEIVKLLIEREDIDLDIKCNNCPPIFTACDHGFDEVVLLIVESRRANLNARYSDETPFNIAFRKDHEKCFRILVEAGVDINAQDKTGSTLFHWLVDKKMIEKAKLLLSIGCNPNIPDFEGYTPFYFACCNGITEIVELLIKREDVNPNIRTKDCPPLVSACDHGFDEIVSFIAKSRKADLNVRYNDETPLTFAFLRGHKKCVKILVEEGADFTAEANFGKNLLFLACEQGFDEVAYVIAQRMGIDININQLDLHNLAIMFNNTKIQINGNFFSQHNYNFVDLNNFLKSFDDEDEQLFRKEVFNSFCSSIVTSIKEGTFQDFKKFINYNNTLQESTVQYVIDYLKKEVNKFIQDIIKRYEQILPVEIEKAGSFKKIEKLKLAYLLEIEIPKVEYVSYKIFSQKNREFPRTLIVERGGSHAFILAKKQFSIIRGEGGCKDVKSALLVPMNRSLKVERVVYAKIIEKTKKYALDALEEYELIKEFSGFTGFGKAYKFFCFDRNGNYVNKQKLSNGRNEEIRSSLVLEEMDGDFDKVVTQLTLNEQVSVTNQLVEAINIMMRKKKVSWDLKTSNILVSKNIQANEIRVAITDLGYAVDIQRGAVRISPKYGSPWYGAPELLYATDVVNDANSHLKCEIWALGVVLYNMCFKIDFPLIDNEFSYKYAEYRHLPVIEQVSYYTLNHAEYARKHNDLVEKPLKDLQLIPKETRTPSQNLEILTYRMLQFDRNIRITPDEALEFCREYLI